MLLFLKSLKKSDLMFLKFSGNHNIITSKPGSAQRSLSALEV